MNNKNAMMKLMMTAVACVAMGTAAVAAPKGGKGPAPIRQEMRGGAKAPPKAQPRPPAKTPAKTTVVRHDARRGREIARHEMRPAPRYEARPPAPPPRRHEPAPPKRHKHHDHHDDNDGWLILGAGVIGGIIAALAG